MSYFDYLRKRLPAYIISGAVFGLALFALIAAGRYHFYITSVLSDMETIVLNKENVKKEIQAIDDLDRYFKRVYNLDLKNANIERHVFRVLDSLKTHFPYGVVNVSRFENTGATRELPVSISTPVRDYASIIEAVSYLESFTLPDFEIRHLTVSKGQMGEVTMNISGSVVIPSFAGGSET